MDISGHFSPTDFLAYLFPGVAGTLGLLALVQLTPAKSTLDILSGGLSTGILFFTVSFIMGVVFSGFSELAIKWRTPQARATIKKSIPTSCFEQDIVDAFRDVFKLNAGAEVQWSTNHFYLCRALVFEKMPASSRLIQRQIGLRQLRMNLTCPIVIWFGVGLAWTSLSIATCEPWWVTMLLALSAALFIPMFFMVINRMDSNEQREVRYVLTGFLVGYKTGMFDKLEKAPGRPAA